MNDKIIDCILISDSEESVYEIENVKSDSDDEINYDNFITNLPSRKITSYRGSTYLISNLEDCRATLIDSFYDVDDDYDDKSALLEINLKRKLGITTRDVIEHFLGTESVGHNDDDNLDLDKNFKHGCENYLKFCQKDVEICKSLDETSTSSKYVYVCDMCNYLENSKVNIKNHIKEKQHLSASIYFMNEKDSSIQLKSRCKIKNEQVKDVDVFCPKCYFCFGSNILACCLHYKYLHQPSNLNVLIYAIVKDKELKKSVDIVITKEYKCRDCQLVFNKLQELSNHLNEFWDHNLNPENENQINVFYCPNNDCEFKSIDYPSLRFHVIKHNNLYKDLNNSNMKIHAKMKTFNKPKEYFHIKYFNSDHLYDQIDELSCIESSLELLKIHPIHKKFITRLEERIDKLRKSIKLK